MNEHTNEQTDGGRDENYVPLGINVRGIIIKNKITFIYIYKKLLHLFCAELAFTSLMN